MRKIDVISAVLAALTISPTAVAQTAARADAPAGFAPLNAPCVVQANGSCAVISATAPFPITASAAAPVNTQGKQESVTLVTANTPAAAVTVYGGNYAFAQGCTTYGTLTLRYRGPDGATMLTLVSKTATDASGATLVQLGSNAVIDATVTGTAGCNASLSRVP